MVVFMTANQMSEISSYPSCTPVSTALLTDHYELTMVRAAMASGKINCHSIFELFTRRLPEGRRYGVLAGVGRALDAIENFRFAEEDIEWLLETNVVDEKTANWLADYKFQGNIWGYREGETYFPGSPLLIVEGGFGEAVILETLLLSIYNFDSAVASAASRMTMMAAGRPIIEMGARRTNEEAAVAAARAAYIAGFTSTSCLAAGRRYRVPTSGTAAHSFTLVHDSEEEAFKAQLDTLGQDTTLLVDTYDMENAIRTGIRLTAGKLGAVRIDSGDLALVAQKARDLLDDCGAESTKVILTGDLDEWQLAALRGAPVDGYGVGTSVVTGSGHPTCSMVYKLVARAASDAPDSPLIPVEKKSAHKNTVGGRKYAARRLDEHGIAEAEVVCVGQEPDLDANHRPLLTQLVKDGEVIGREPLSAARQRHLDSLGELPDFARRLSKGEAAIPTVILDQSGNRVKNPYRQAPPTP